MTALGKVVGLDFSGEGELPHPGDEPPVPAHDPADQPRDREAIESTRLPVALSGGEDQGEPSRTPWVW